MNAFTDGYVQFSVAGVDTIVKVDVNGGGDNFQTLVTITNALLTESDTANYNI